MLSASGNLFECHEEVLDLQPMIPPKRFENFPPITKGCSEGLGVLWFFFKQQPGSNSRPTVSEGYPWATRATGYCKAKI